MIRNADNALEWYGANPDIRRFAAPWMVRFAKSIRSVKAAATVRKVNRWFGDHANFQNSPGFAESDPTAERIAWHLLGGDAGREWAAAYVADKFAQSIDTFAAGGVELLAPDRPGLSQLIRYNPDDWADDAAFADLQNRDPEWGGLIAFEEVATSDRRKIRGMGLTWRSLPFPLLDQRQTAMGHEGAVAVGPFVAINRVSPADVLQLTDGRVEIPGNGFGIAGFGLWATGEAGEMARQETEEGTKQGVSVDLTEMKINLPTDPEELEEIIFGDGEIDIVAAKIAAATKVPIPAFEHARLQIIGDIPQVEPQALVASGGLLEGVTMRMIVPMTTFEVRRPGPPLVSFSGVHVPTSSNTPGIQWRETDPEPGYPSEVAEWQDQLDAMVASGGLPMSHTPPPCWFSERQYSEFTPKVIEPPDEHGRRRIHGHVAAWGSCHLGNPTVCHDVPRGLDYSSFQGPKVESKVFCDDGSTLNAGPVIIDNVHPNLKARASDALAHYHHTRSMVANVCAYEDQFGLQIQGWLLPRTTADDIVVLNGAQLSPDWRPRATAFNGKGVVAILGVPVSAFNTALVASGAPPVEDLDDVVDVDEDLVVWLSDRQHAADKVEVLQDLDLPVPGALLAKATAVSPDDPAEDREQVLAVLRG